MNKYLFANSIVIICMVSAMLLLNYLKTTLEFVQSNYDTYILLLGLFFLVNIFTSLIVFLNYHIKLK